MNKHQIFDIKYQIKYVKEKKCETLFRTNYRKLWQKKGQMEFPV